jgi:hypothetical protein
MLALAVGCNYLLRLGGWAVGRLGEGMVGMNRSLAILAAFWLLAPAANAQTPPPSPVSSGGAAPGRTIPCDRLPPEAVKVVPAPFDRYMRFECNPNLGQGLVPLEGFHWTSSDGIGIGLSASATRPDAKGEVDFPFSWYTRLQPINLSKDEQRALRSEFKRAIKAKYLNHVGILELAATTSNAETKRIYLVVPAINTGPKSWIVGFECNGACFREDPDPMVFFGESIDT